MTERGEQRSGVVNDRRQQRSDGLQLKLTLFLVNEWFTIGGWLAFFFYLFIYLFIIIIFVEGNRSVSIELGSCRVFGLRSIPAEWCASYPNPMENANVKNVEPKQSDSKSTMILMMFNKRNVALLGAQVPSKSR